MLALRCISVSIGSDVYRLRMNHVKFHGKPLRSIITDFLPYTFIYLNMIHSSVFIDPLPPSLSTSSIRLDTLAYTYAQYL